MAAMKRGRDAREAASATAPPKMSRPGGGDTVTIARMLRKGGKLAREKQGNQSVFMASVSLDIFTCAVDMLACIDDALIIPTVRTPQVRADMTPEEKEAEIESCEASKREHGGRVDELLLGMSVATQGVACKVFVPITKSVIASNLVVDQASRRILSLQGVINVKMMHQRLMVLKSRAKAQGMSNAVAIISFLKNSTFSVSLHEDRIVEYTSMYVGAVEKGVKMSGRITALPLSFSIPTLFLRELLAEMKSMGSKTVYISISEITRVPRGGGAPTPLIPEGAIVHLINIGAGTSYLFDTTEMVQTHFMQSVCSATMAVKDPRTGVVNYRMMTKEECDVGAISDLPGTHWGRMLSHSVVDKEVLDKVTKWFKESEMLWIPFQMSMPAHRPLGTPLEPQHLVISQTLPDTVGHVFVILQTKKMNEASTIVDEEEDADADADADAEADADADADADAAATAATATAT